ncbi:MAG: TVP38/TMEM64 family protein [bacterium]|nr:TVP38/TMEM64 family protein [bacterium]
MSPPLRLALAVLLVAAACIAVAHVAPPAWLSVDGMRRAVEAAGVLGPLVFLGVFVAGFFIPGPEILFAALGGILFGGLPGFVYAYVASLIGTTTTFFLVRYTAQEYAQRALRDRFEWIRALDERLVHRGVLTVTGLRLLLFLSPPLNWALGATRVRTSHYVFGTAIGIVPGLAAAVYFGDVLGATGSVSDVLRPGVVLPAAAALLLVATVAVAAHRLRAGRSGRA